MGFILGLFFLAMAVIAYYYHKASYPEQYGGKPRPMRFNEKDDEDEDDGRFVDYSVIDHDARNPHKFGSSD